MTVLVPPRRLVTPAQRTGLAASLWKDCILAVPFWRGVPRDVSGNDVPVHLAGSPPIVATEIGYALDLNGSSQAAWANLPVLNPAFNSDRISVTIVMKWRSGDSQVITELSGNYNATNRTFLNFITSTPDLAVSIHDTKALYENPKFEKPAPGSWNVLTNTLEHTPFGQSFMRSRHYRAGVRQPEIDPGMNSTPVTSGPFANAVLNIGARNKGGSLYLNGQIAAVILHDRMLSDAEIALLGRDPFIMFREDPVAITALAGGVAGGAVTGVGALVVAPGAAMAASTVRATASSALPGPVARVSARAEAPVSAAAVISAPASMLTLGGDVGARASMGIAPAFGAVSGSGAVTVLAGGVIAAPLPRLSAGSASRCITHAIDALWPGLRRIEGASAGARRMTGLWRETP